jgi:hypothetical protein
MSTTILAGNPADLAVTFTSRTGEAFSAPTATVYVTDADDNSELVDETVEMNGDNTTATITATWPVPADADAGRYTFTIVLTNGTETRTTQHAFQVVARVEPDVPVA